MRNLINTKLNELSALWDKETDIKANITNTKRALFLEIEDELTKTILDFNNDSEKIESFRKQKLQLLEEILLEMDVKRDVKKIEILTMLKFVIKHNLKIRLENKKMVRLNDVKKLMTLNEEKFISNTQIAKIVGNKENEELYLNTLQGVILAGEKAKNDALKEIFINCNGNSLQVKNKDDLLAVIKHLQNIAKTK